MTFVKGQTPWNKNKSMSDYPQCGFQRGHKGFFEDGLSEIHKSRLSKSHLGISHNQKKETREKISLGLKARYKAGERKPIIMAGDKNPRWKGGIRGENYLERRRFRSKMQKLIFERDGYRCQICEGTGELQVDHIQSWAEFKELRFDADNCRTLCTKCHYKITFNREMPATLKGWGHNLVRRVAQ